jgi:hypothetical protein
MSARRTEALGEQAGLEQVLGAGHFVIAEQMAEIAREI